MHNPNISKWMQTNRFVHTQFPVAEMAAAVKQKGLRITVLIPAKEVASAIGNVIQKTVLPLLEARVVNRVWVIDAGSVDQTATVAKAAGAEVLQREQIASELGDSKGKGDALWRGLLATDGDIVAFLDGDTEDPIDAHLIGIIGPLIFFDHIEMVRACFDRPFKEKTGEIRPHDGGRVTEILARPILNLHWPELTGFGQPLAGEFAARRDLLERLYFPTGYGVEIATLIDTYRLKGLHALAEVNIGQRQNAHKPLRDLTPMAATILATVEGRRFPLEPRPGEVKLYIPWLDDYRVIGTAERPPVQDYKRFHTAYPSPPFHMVEGVRMLRDIGGDTTARHLQGLVFRSGDPSGISVSGVKQLLELGIKKIFDLRSHCELAHCGGSSNGIYPGMLGQVGIERVAVPVFGDEEWLPEQRSARLKHYANAEEGYANAYLYILEKGAKAFLPILQHLAQPDPAPILVHCTAGKDRTGVLVMIILLLAGCDDGSIATEYAYNDLDSDRSWGISAVNRLLKQPGLSGNVSAVENVVRARRSYMLATLELFRAEYGSVASYLKRVANLDDATIQRLIENLAKV